MFERRHVLKLASDLPPRREPPVFDPVPADPSPFGPGWSETMGIVAPVDNRRPAAVVTFTPIVGGWLMQAIDPATEAVLCQSGVRA